MSEVGSHLRRVEVSYVHVEFNVRLGNRWVLAQLLIKTQAPVVLGYTAKQRRVID